MSLCPRCRIPFHCGVADGGANDPCWCMALPPLPPARMALAGPADQCLCPACLRELARDQKEDEGRNDPAGGI